MNSSPASGLRRACALAAACALAFLFALFTSSPQRAWAEEAGTVTASWGSNCTSIGGTASGWPEGYQVQVRTYNSFKQDEKVYLFPADKPWTLSVDPGTVRGFSYRMTDASGTWVTPLQEAAATCVVVIKPVVALTATSCDTLHLQAAGLPLNDYAVGEVRVFSEEGALVKTFSGAKAFDETFTLPGGHSYTAQAGFVWQGAAWYSKATSSAVALEQCPAPVEEPSTPVEEPSTPAPVEEAPSAEPSVTAAQENPLPVPLPVEEPSTPAPAEEPAPAPMEAPAPVPVEEVPAPAPVEDVPAPAPGEDVPAEEPSTPVTPPGEDPSDAGDTPGEDVSTPSSEAPQGTPGPASPAGPTATALTAPGPQVQQATVAQEASASPGTLAPLPAAAPSQPFLATTGLSVAVEGFMALGALALGGGLLALSRRR